MSEAAPAANGKDLAGFLAARAVASDDDFGDDVAAMRELLELDDPWRPGRESASSVGHACRRAGVRAVREAGGMIGTGEARDGVGRLVGGIAAWDEVEGRHLAQAREWAGSGAPLYRVRKPDVPPMHLVCYFVVRDESRDRLLLVAHRKAGLWLPAGGHVEPGEDPWDTVVRECREELHIDAVPSAVAGRRPFFLTVTETRGRGRHTDVSLWYVLSADAGSVTSFDEGEFEAIRWLTPEEVLAEPVSTLDPHMHRFTRKLPAAGTAG